MSNMFTDAHIHILDTIKKIEKNPQNQKLSREAVFSSDIFFCASADKRDVFEEQERICLANSANFILSFGVHPQAPDEKEICFLEKLIKEKRIKAIGECGFDLFNSEFKATEKMQKRVWDIQTELAIQNSLPMIIHCRKALHLLFKDANRLKKISAIIFHGWAGSSVEANSFLQKGVNAFFCIGKGILRGQKAQIETAAKLDLTRLLTETDAPYMQLNGEPYSLPNDVKKVFNELARRRDIPSFESENLKTKIFQNFQSAYGIRS